MPDRRPTGQNLAQMMAKGLAATARAGCTALVFATIGALSLVTQAHAAPGALKLPWSDTASYAISGNTYYCDTHRGAEQFAIDFGLPDGTAVTAVFAGTAYRASSTAGGLAIYVQHAGGFTSYYGHLSQQIATNGQAVVQGTVIGYSGHTGSPTPGAHLHFSIKQGGSGAFDGSPIKPEPMSGYSGFGAFGWTRYAGSGCPTFVTSSGYWSIGPDHLPVAANNQNGLQSLFIATSTNAWFTTQTPTISAPWNAWLQIGNANNVGRLSAARDALGMLELFSRGAEGQIWVNKQAYQSCRGASSCFPTWIALPGVLMSDPTVVRNGDGRLGVFAVGTDQALWHTWQNTDGTWTAHGWLSLGGNIEGLPAIGVNQNGTLEVFARMFSPTTFDPLTGVQGVFLVYNIWQVTTGPNASWTAQWQNIGVAPVTSDPTAAVNSDGTLEVFDLYGSNNYVIHARQVNPNAHTSYAGWDDLNGNGNLGATGPMPIESSPMPIQNLDGTLEVFGFCCSATNGQGQIVHAWQPSTAWTMTWGSVNRLLPGTLASVPALGPDGYFQNNVEIFAYTPNEVQNHDYQTNPGPPTDHLAYSGWNYVH